MKLQIGEMEPQMDISCQQMKQLHLMKLLDKVALWKPANNTGYCQSYWLISTN